MGNCVQSGRHGAAFAGEGRRRVLVQPQRSGGRRSSGEKDEEADGEAGASSPSVVKVKMVLTKDELAWLVARIKAGDRRIEGVLHEMARKREGRAAAGDEWRPGLESIVECPAETTEAAAGSSSDG